MMPPRTRQNPRNPEVQSVPLPEIIRDRLRMRVREHSWVVW